MDKEQRERLEQELRFLKESLEADVISRDEYERGRERIERKLREIEESEEEVEEEKEEIKEEPKIEIKEIKEKPVKIIGAKEETKAPEEEIKEIEEEPKEKIVVEEEEKEIKEEEEKVEGIKEEKKEIEEPEEEITISKKWVYGIAILIIILILSFFIRSCKSIEGEKLAKEKVEEEAIEKFTPECSSDPDCEQEGMIGKCLNPGTKEARCEFEEDIKVNLMVINDKDCKLCDSSNMKDVIKEIFPNVNIEDIDYVTREAKKLISKFDINTLPSYIFDSNISNAINFNDFRNALIKKGDNYIITNTASGASYYFKRKLIKDKLDLYVLPETTETIGSNMQEVLDLFKDKINFTKHIVSESQKEILKEELGINTYPTFLINNQFKFRGILPSNTIKEKICAVNYFEECKVELSKV